MGLFLRAPNVIWSSRVARFAMYVNVSWGHSLTLNRHVLNLLNKYKRSLLCLFLFSIFDTRTKCYIQQYRCNSIDISKHSSRVQRSICRNENRMTLRLRGGGGCGTCVSGGCGSKTSGSNLNDPDDDEAAELADAVFKASSESEVAIEEASNCNIVASQQEAAAAKERRIRKMASDGLTIFSFKSFLDWFVNEWLSTYLRNWYLPIFEALDADSSGRSVRYLSCLFLVYS
jgi:hypothetical protein